MGFCCCTGAYLHCPFGTIPSQLFVLPKGIVGMTGPMATCMDCVPFLNISSFGLCKSPSNPATQAATAAAGGIFTPGPCFPTPIGTWLPTRTNLMTLIGPMLTDDSTLTCAFNGIIKIDLPGQFLIEA